MTQTLISHRVDSLMIDGKSPTLYLGDTANAPIVTCATPELWNDLASKAILMAQRLCRSTYAVSGE